MRALEEAVRNALDNLARAVSEAVQAGTSAGVPWVPPRDGGPPPPRVGYRPQPGSGGDRPPMTFRPVAGADRPTPPDLTGLHDAFTGAPLDVKADLYQCPRCQVYYHRASLEVINAENGGRCVACLATGIALRVSGAPAVAGRDAAPSSVTLEDYRHHVGRVITFEGTVRRINRSRDGRHLAVMFEDASWARGLKLVLFRGSIGKVGGYRFVEGLLGRTVRVRGLLVRHERYGYQIVINDRAMILAVR